MSKFTEKVAKNRERYLDVISQYKFLDELDEIEKYSINVNDDSPMKPR